MSYFLFALLSLITLKSYIIIAKKANIIDKPNARSSHSTITVRGGGIIFPISLLIWLAIRGFQYPFFSVGLLIISLVSFYDDIFTLSAKFRLIIHSIAISFIFVELRQYQLPIWLWAIILIVIVGIINAYNFMDGINGITGGYSLSVLIALWAVNNNLISFIDNDIIYITTISILIFLIFNFRKNAICFAGDVGSVSIAFFLIFLLLKLIILSNNPYYILFMLIYGVDTISTIVYRILKKENIFEAHRKHLYQLMSNELKVPQLLVSSIYSLIQLTISIVVILLIKQNTPTLPMLIISLGIIIITTTIHIALRYFIISKTK